MHGVFSLCSLVIGGIAGVDDHVVDEAGLADPRGDGHENGPSVEALCRLEVVRVARLEVLGLDLGLGEDRARRVEGAVDALAAAARRQRRARG